MKHLKKTENEKSRFLIITYPFGSTVHKNESKTAEASEVKTETSTDSLKSYAEKTKVLLVSNLTQKIKDSGAVGALEFCNIEAMPLTKSMSDKYNLEIKRVTDKNRNPQNLASAEEIKS